MQKPPFSSYFDFFPNVWEGTPTESTPIPTPAYFDFALRHTPDQCVDCLSWDGTYTYLHNFYDMN